jgi:hypothetical protein
MYWLGAADATIQKFSLCGVSPGVNGFIIPETLSRRADDRRGLRASAGNELLERAIGEAISREPRATIRQRPNDAGAVGCTSYECHRAVTFGVAASGPQSARIILAHSHPLEDIVHGRPRLQRALSVHRQLGTIHHR